MLSFFCALEEMMSQSIDDLQPGYSSFSMLKWNAHSQTLSNISNFNKFK